MGGLSERNARAAAGVVYATSSARSVGSGIQQQEDTSTGQHHSNSTTDLRESKMHAKATKALHVCVDGHHDYVL